MERLDKERHLKLIIITDDGIPYVYYEDYLGNEETPDNVRHFQIIQKIVKKGNEQVLPNKVARAVRMAAHNSYPEAIETFHDFNYSIFLDTTHYENYHNEKLHTGVWLMPGEFDKLSKGAQKTFLSLLPKMGMGQVDLQSDQTEIGYSEIYAEYKDDLEINIEHSNKDNVKHFDILSYVGIEPNVKRIK